MNIKPTKDRILVKPIRNSEYTAGGVYVPRATTTFVNSRDRDLGRDRSEQVTVGEIIAVGPGRVNKHGRRIPVDARPGDIVTFSDTCSRPVDIDGIEYRFIKEADIAGFLDEPTNVELVYA